MTTAEQLVPRTVRELLFGHGAETPEAIARRLAAEPKLDHALKNLKKVTREIAVREIADTTAGLLDVNLVDIIIGAWRKYQELTAAARRTLAAPDSTELIELADHQFTEEQQPYINLLVDDHRVATLTLDATVVFDVHSLVAGIKAGRLVAVHAGHCDVTGTLDMENVEVARRQARIPLHGVLPLGHGIRLLPATEYSVLAAKPAETAKGLSRRRKGGTRDRPITDPGGFNGRPTARPDVSRVGAPVVIGHVCHQPGTPALNFWGAWPASTVDRAGAGPVP